MLKLKDQFPVLPKDFPFTKKDIFNIFSDNLEESKTLQERIKITKTIDWYNKRDREIIFEDLLESKTYSIYLEYSNIATKFWNFSPMLSIIEANTKILMTDYR